MSSRFQYPRHFSDGCWWIRYPGDHAQCNDQLVLFLVEIQPLDISLSTTKNRVQLFLAGTLLSRIHHARTGINGVDAETARGEGHSEAARPAADFENSRSSRETKAVDQHQSSFTPLLVNEGEDVRRTVDIVPELDVVIKV